MDLDRPRLRGTRPSRWPSLCRRQADDPGGSEKPTAQVRVAGTYRSLVGTVLPPFWCSLKGVFGTPDENAPPPPVILTTTATFTRILGEAGVHTLSSYRWEQPPSSGVDLEQARAPLRRSRVFSTAWARPSHGPASGSPDPRRVPIGGRRPGPVRVPRHARAVGAACG